MSPKAEFEAFVRRQLASLCVPDGEPAKPHVGPFDQGLFLRSDGAGGALGEFGQWGMIRPGALTRREFVEPKPRPGPAPDDAVRRPKAAKPRQTNNARIETIAQRPTFRGAWSAGRRCLIPASWYQEPNWELKRNVWWHLRRQDGLPWMLAGLWSHWTEPDTGEIVANFTMLTCNCDTHPLLRRLHKPDPKLPADQQDKRSVIHIEPEHWGIWLDGPLEAARELIAPAPVSMFDPSDAIAMDRMLSAR